MSYTLLYSRAIQDVSVLRVLDVPITDRSVMIEVLSLLSPFRRLAGYAYALRSDGITDYERSSGVTLPFGKNRVNFTAATPPYFLEFFPRWGVRSGIISVYTGEPDPVPVPPGPWRQSFGFGIEFRAATTPKRIEYRRPIDTGLITFIAPGFVEGCFKDGFLRWRREDGAYRYAVQENLSVENQADAQEFINAMANPSSIII